MKKKTKVIVSSAMSIAVCASLIAGSTFALFTSESKTNIAITSGKVSMVASLTLTDAYSAEWLEGATDYTQKALTVEDDAAEFTNGGTARYADGTLSLNNISPGDGVKFKVSIQNESSIAIAYKFSVSAGADDGLFDALKVNIFDDTGERAYEPQWVPVKAGEDIPDLNVNVELPITADNTYAEKSCVLACTVYAMQGNGHVTELNSKTGKSLRDTLREGTSPSVELTGNLNSGASFHLKSDQISQTIDLNGHTLRGAFHSFGFDWSSKTNYTHDTDIYIRNGKIDSTTVQNRDSYGYGISLIGAREQDTGTVTLHLDNVHVFGTYVGLATNGMDRGVKIIANNCTFEGGISGVYLPADAECEFNGCTFIGSTGICARAGKVTLNNCTVKGQGEYTSLPYFPSGNCGGNGSAILIPGSDSAYGMLSLSINGGKLVSENGYGIEELCGLPLTQNGSKYPACHLESLIVNETETSCKLGAMYVVSESKGEAHSDNFDNWEIPEDWRN